MPFELTVGPGARFLDIDLELERHGLTLLSMTSGKGGTLIGWMATGGMGFGTFHHGTGAKSVDLHAGDHTRRKDSGSEGRGPGD